MRFECNGPPNPPSRMVPSEQQPWVGEFGSWHRRLLDNATSVRRRRERFDTNYFYSQCFCAYRDTNVTTACYVPVELCLSFPFFFFLHFQGLKMRPRLASLLLRRMGGVWTPVTRQPDLSTLCWSTRSTAATVKEKKRDGEVQYV